MERTAVRRRLTWQLARVIELVAENARTTSLVLQPPDGPGHLAGQHVDIKSAEPGEDWSWCYVDEVAFVVG